MRKFVALALSIAALALGACGSSAAKDVPSSTEPLASALVTLEARGSQLDKTSEIVWDGLARNDERRALIGLSVTLTLKRSDGTVIKTLEVSPVSSRERITVLEPGFSIPIHVREKVSEAPASIVARITAAEKFAESSDAPRPLEVKPIAGADAAVLELVSLGHFSVGAFPEATGPTPFHMSLGIRNKAGAPLSRAELQIVFTDDDKKEVDRISVARDFVPALRPGDGVIDLVVGDARPHTQFFVEVRTLTPAN